MSVVKKIIKYLIIVVIGLLILDMIFSPRGPKITVDKAEDYAIAKLAEFCDREKISISDFNKPKIEYNYNPRAIEPGWLFSYRLASKPNKGVDIYVDEYGGSDIISRYNWY